MSWDCASPISGHGSAVFTSRRRAQELEALETWITTTARAHQRLLASWPRAQMFRCFSDRAPRLTSDVDVFAHQLCRPERAGEAIKMARDLAHAFRPGTVSARREQWVYEDGPDREVNLSGVSFAIYLYAVACYLPSHRAVNRARVAAWKAPLGEIFRLTAAVDSSPEMATFFEGVLPEWDDQLDDLFCITRSLELEGAQ